MRIILFLCLILLCFCDENDHKYQYGSILPLYVSTVGPRHNPQEIYPYYSLPFCQPEKFEYKFPSIGEAFQGIQLVRSKIQIQFKKDVGKTPICSKTITPEILKQFQYAIDNEYYYALYLDDLPIWGLVGYKKDGNYYIYTHQHYSIGVYKDKVTQLNVTSSTPQLLKLSLPFSFSFSTQFMKSEITFEQRFRRYLDIDFFEHKIHWFSIFNSFMMVLFLSGIVFMILIKMLNSDLLKYTKDLESNQIQDETGWKQLSGDIFRSPSFLELFSALIGTGFQLFVLVFFVIIFAIIDTYYDDRGAFLTSFIIIYCFTSIISGYISSSNYVYYNGERWKFTMFLTSVLFPGICGIIGSVLNTIAIAYGSLMAVPFGFILLILCSWIFITLPLVIIGTILGRNYTSVRRERVNPYPTPIPLKNWYSSRFTFILISGILPFGSIFIETYYVFTSFWNYKFYFVYGFMLLVYIILMIVTSCVSIVTCYLLLNNEDYRWQWTSFYSSASCSFYIFLYSIYFFYTKTKMTGLLQVSFYFGYTLVICLAIAILCGTVGFYSTKYFIQKIYASIKSE